jgi:hypothetical protein
LLRRYHKVPIADSPCPGSFCLPASQLHAAGDLRNKFAFVDNPENAQIQCTWENGLNFEFEEAGNTTIVSGPDHSIVSAKIRLTLSRRPELAAGLDKIMTAICLHQIGHALGLAGHTCRPGDFMFYTVLPIRLQSQLSARDISTIRELYPASKN